MRKPQRLTITVILTLLSVLLFALPAKAALIGGEGGFYYSLRSDKTALLEEYHGSAEDIAIPREIYSYTVTAIAENTFSNNTAIKSVNIPDSITAIGAYAFYGCANLESVVIPDSITEIKAATFYGCSSLKEVIIPASVTRIAANAFNNCENLVIVAESGSYAETFAGERGISFESTDAPAERIFGDADGDSVVTSADALLVLTMSVESGEFDEDTMAALDVDADGSLTSADALELLCYSANMSANDRIGQPI